MKNSQTEEGENEELLQWASNFIEEIARGEHANLATLDHLTEEQHAALAEFVGSAMEQDDPALRRAGAWVTSQIAVIPEDAPRVAPATPARH